MLVVVNWLKGMGWYRLGAFQMGGIGGYGAMAAESGPPLDSRGVSNHGSWIRYGF
jgi:hypothetical protein